MAEKLLKPKNMEIYCWQMAGWPRASVNRAALGDELRAFAAVFAAVKKSLRQPQDMEVVARALADEAVKTSDLEGVTVDESVVMSSICKALGVTCAPKGFVRDLRAEGVAQMMLAVREKWNQPITSDLLKGFHKALMAGEKGDVAVGAFRLRAESMRVVRRRADGTVEIRFEAPPSERVTKEICAFERLWGMPAVKPAEVALKAAMMHLHFESIHPFEDGNGRVGRALVAKTIAEGLGFPLVLPVSTAIARHRVAYYDEICAASRSLDWTNWAAFFIPVLTEMLASFLSAAGFVVAKRKFLTKFESRMTERSRKVILRMFEGGEAGARGILSAAKWLRMTKVSKPTALADLAELEKMGAVVRVTGGQRLEYRISCFGSETIQGAALNGEPLNEPINESISERLIKVVRTHPGSRLAYLKSVVGMSEATVKRAIAALVTEGRVEHRGSKKTGGYFAKVLD